MTCETCVFWKRGDVSKKNIGNVGQCTFLLPQTIGFYDVNPGVPFWAQGTVHRTASFEGEYCKVWAHEDGLGRQEAFTAANRKRKGTD